MHSPWADAIRTSSSRPRASDESPSARFTGRAAGDENTFKRKNFAAASNEENCQPQTPHWVVLQKLQVLQEIIDTDSARK
jgi:hypothetical protein